MRTTLDIDDELLAKASEYSGISEVEVLVNQGLKMIVEWEASRRLAKLGGSEPQLKPIPRRRSEPSCEPS